jgi:uncharacterized protein
LPIQESDIYACLANNVLRLILMPTEACNFRCTYCYEDFEYRRMDDEVVHGVKAFLAQRLHDLDSLTLSWFGGEPLLARDIVEDLLAYAGALVREKPEMRFASDMTTNGSLLSPGVFRRLLDLGVTTYQISFDGPREWHDRTRVQANRRGTFDRIWDNVAAMRKVDDDFKVVVRLHIHQENVSALPRFVEEYARFFADDPRFRLFFRQLSSLGGPCEPAVSLLAGAELERRLEELKRCAESHGVRYMTTERPMVCYAARGNAFVVRSNGRLNKCTVALEHPANQVGLLKPDGRLQIDAGRMQGWMRGVLSNDMEALECPMRGFADPQAPPSGLQVTA